MPSKVFTREIVDKEKPRDQTLTARIYFWGHILWQDSSLEVHLCQLFSDLPQELQGVFSYHTQWLPECLLLPTGASPVLAQAEEL